jgi:phosphatidylinositol alpha-1,6-mannosyltransferase
MPEIRRRVAGAALVIVGGGPDADTLHKLAQHCGVAADVVFTGGVPAAELPGHYAMADVFAMPCRTRGAGLDVEGLGIVFLEAAAAGVPVVAGRSGGAPETVRDGETGRVVNGRAHEEIVDAITDLLTDPDRARLMGQAGRDWISRDWNWQTHSGRLAALLRVAPPR